MSTAGEQPVADTPLQGTHHTLTFRPIPQPATARFIINGTPQFDTFSPNTAHSMPMPQPTYSPLFIATPMHTPMVEEDEEDSAGGPEYIDPEIFQFNEELESSGSDSDDMDDDAAPHNEEQDQILQEIMDKLNDLKRQGDVRNQMLRDIIAGQQ